MENIDQFLSEDIISFIIAISFVLILVFFTIMSFVFNLHWKQYGISGKDLKKLKKVYFSGSFIIFLIIVTVSIVYFSL